MKIYRLQVTPVPKPRMVRSDSWRKRPAVLRYWAFKDAINLEMIKQKFVMPDKPFIIYNLPMPDSWSQKKKDKMFGTLHTQKPDIDNLIKSWDAWIEDDSYITCVFAFKKWAHIGSVVICDISYVFDNLDYALTFS